jgi:TonB family protein
MTSPLAESQVWPRRRWLVSVVLVLASQLGFVFWLAARKTDIPAMPPARPLISLPADQTADLPGVTDPTLFVLPNLHGFSGPAWMQFAPATYTLEPWTEPQRPLELTTLQLGATLAEFVHANHSPLFEVDMKPEPRLDAVGYLPLEEAPSSFSVEGDVANRPLLTPLTLDSWPAAEILLPTEVQIAVDAAGRVISAVVLKKSASAEANASALSLARSARFQPLRWIGPQPPPAAPDRLSWGKIIFRWHTVAPPNPAAPPNK